VPGLPNRAAQAGAVGYATAAVAVLDTSLKLEWLLELGYHPLHGLLGCKLVQCPVPEPFLARAGPLPRRRAPAHVSGLWQGWIDVSSQDFDGNKMCRRSPVIPALDLQLAPRQTAAQATAGRTVQVEKGMQVNVLN
jgi:hypothetical protein